MIVGSMLKKVQAVVQRGLHALGAAISRLTRPIPTSPTAGCGGYIFIGKETGNNSMIDPATLSILSTNSLEYGRG